MKTFLLPTLSFFGLILGMASPSLRAQFVSGQPAQSVLGQPTFATSAIGSGVAGLNAPTRTTVDRITGAVYVADSGNNRVLRYANADAMANGAAAELVLGQPDFVTTTAGTSAVKMSDPRGLAITSAGQLWVADRMNHRVLRFDDARNASTGDPADAVLGQPLFDSNMAATSQSGMRNPEGVAVQTTGTLFVADANNHRVVFFTNASLAANGADAAGVLGQADFVSSSIGTTATTFTGPTDVEVNGLGTLFVTDSGNNRIIRFNFASAKANGAAADGVLGQADFVTSSVGISASEFSNPVAISLSQFGALYIADEQNNRVLKIEDAANESGEIDANLVLGQSNFVSNAPSLSAPGLVGPSGVVISPFTEVYAVQPNANRVSRFGIFTPAPAPDPEPAADTTRPIVRVKGRRSVDSRRNRVVFRGTATDATGIAKVEYKVSGQRGFKKARGTSRWKAVIRPNKKKRKTVVRVRAIDPAGNRSSFLKLKIFRR